jgi:hypothetical protein
MPRLTTITPEFVDTVPPDDELKDGVIYISEKYSCAIHMCACGCRVKTVMPINYKQEDGTMTTFGWDYTWVATDSVSVTFSPSVGNMQFPCKSHYFIRNNKIEWC